MVSNPDKREEDIVMVAQQYSVMSYGQIPVIRYKTAAVSHSPVHCIIAFHLMTVEIHIWNSTGRNTQLRLFPRRLHIISTVVHKIEVAFSLIIVSEQESLHLPKIIELALLSSCNQGCRQFCPFLCCKVKPPYRRTETYHRVHTHAVIKELHRHVDFLVTHIPEHLAHHDFRLLDSNSMIWAFTCIEGIAMHSPDLIKANQSGKVVKTVLKVSLFPFVHNIEVIHRDTVESSAGYESTGGVKTDKVIPDIFMPQRGIRIRILDKDMYGNRSIVFCGLVLKPVEAFLSRSIFLTFQGLVEFMERRVFPVMAFILPPHKVDNLRQAAGNDIQPLYDIQGIRKCKPDL